MDNTNKTWRHTLLALCLMALPQLSAAALSNDAEKAVESKTAVAAHFPAENQNCLACHQGIEPARPFESQMMKDIMAEGAALGDANGCVVCHAGTPGETQDKTKAHSGAPKGSKLSGFTATPGALQVSADTCGSCHAEHNYAIERSHMNTDAGKMKTIMTSFGINADNADHIYGDHAVNDPDGMTPIFGTDKYKAYMLDMAKKFPGQYPSELKAVPKTNLERLKDMPEEAAFNYLRNCNACHLSNKGLQDRGHFRGMGCSACHTLYNNEGYYEGGDKSIAKNEPGHIMTHAMQSSRKSASTVNGTQISGVQVSTCASCHTAGRRIGFSYQGFMPLGHSDNRGPFDENGKPQEKNAGYVYKYIRNDAHHRIEKDGKTVTGLLCQDCHTSNAMHGNGNIGSTTLATIEIECSDCHGSTQKFPWELPLGFGDEFGKDLKNAPARGLSDRPMDVTEKFGMVYDKEDGYLLSSRGNPLGNVVRRGDKVIVHSDAGNDFEVPVLKTMAKENSWQNPEKATVAMVRVEKHMESLECYACHSTWAPQYYGYKSVMDFSKQTIDWIGSAEVLDDQKRTADSNGNPVMMPGAEVTGDYSHVRWENPPLGINGEGRVSPLTGVIQMVSTVIGPDGKTIASSRVAKTSDGINAMELAPLQPHTASRQSRDCTECHGNSVAAGYGMEMGEHDAKPEEVRFADVVDANGQNVSKFTKEQIHAIKGLHGDFMAILNPDGKQVQLVDSHWPDSMPLTAHQREKLARTGTCIACHQDIPDGSIPMVMLQQIGKVAGMEFASPEAHDSLLWQNNLLIAWIKAVGIVMGVLALIGLPFFLRWRRNRKNAK